MAFTYPLELRKQVVDFIDENPQISLINVAEKFGVSTCVAWRWHKKIGRNLRAPKRKFTDEQLLTDLYLYPHDTNEVRKIRLGTSTQVISFRIRKLGLYGRARYRLAEEKKQQEKQHEKWKKTHLGPIISKIQYAVKDPSSLERYPQTLENWLHGLLEEVQELMTVG
jgi:hypothetical protein